MDDINVIVVDRGRKYLYLRYTDPVTGQKLEKSSGTAKKREAIKAAGEWQAELRSGKRKNNSQMPWSEFREDFFENYIDHLSSGYGDNVSATFNVVEDTMNPDRLNRITTEWLKRFRKKVEGKSEATIHKYFQHIGTALTWARDQEYIASLPTFPSQKKGASKGKKHMKGRPITAEEYDRMVGKCEFDSIKYLMEGLWLSGLRIGEALALTWDQWADGIRIQVDGSDVYLLIDAEDQKNRETELYPVVDDFAEFLLHAPPAERSGFVFNPCRSSGKVTRRIDTVSGWLVDIGENAGVKVDQKTVRNKKTGKDEVKPLYASAHDFRRAFGDRWSRIVPPMILKDLMRHASVATTEQFYVGVNAKKTIEALREFKKASEVTLRLTPEGSSDPEKHVDQ